MAIAAANLPAEATVADSSDWAGAIRQRRKALLQRLGMASASALIFSPLLGWSLSFAWVIGYFIIQLLDVWVFAPIVSGKTDRLNGARRVAGWIMLSLNAAYFGSLSVPLWLIGGTMGGICAVMLLSAGSIYAVINAPRSTSVMLMTATIQFLYLAATPVFMAIHGATPGFVTAAAISVGVFITYCLSTWQRMNEARLAESAARVEAEEKRAQAEQIMAGRSAFLAAIGHDLRTPISAILTGAAELERGATDAAARSQAHLITDAGFMMKAMLDDLLDHAKLDAGHMTVDQVDFNLRDLLNQTTRLWRGPARAKGLKLRVEGAATIPAAVRGDPMRVRQVLNNLISNAMKFTETGSITLRLNAWTEEPGGHAVLIAVEDTGPGMTAEQVARLFTPFDQTMAGVSAQHGGTGLGLAISRQLAELMGGRVTVRTRPGDGASFTLALTLLKGEAVEAPPRVLDQDSRDAVARALSGRMTGSSAPIPTAQSLVPAAQPETAPAPEIAAPGPVVPAAPESEPVADEEDEGRPMRVLVVDDHDINRRAIQLILQPLGCDIATAADGMAALKICEQTAFDLIFMDVRMPELDGRETTRRIRAGDGPNAGVPIIAVTADTAAEDIAACTDAGMTYFVPKPITPPMLLGAITHVMTMAQAEEAPEAETVAA
ncbi:MAG: response regulator [Alphaproteobacteria bacterium]|jgi:two-component system, sensor histidine kinase|nr:response regulator [Alphaproteobacteria bacterium]MBU2043186.1 response regulator [Alphaproteobacteria bacterium]MBU2126796.1 response regulator [Alphaproteobacteria bacterium]MBU2209885.1 response regulator [Alphaproteobacteria bacterium]MBU2290930.1 response regulator [Alphaproteobacteria bacterium]